MYIDEPGVERGEPETEGVRSPEVGDDGGTIDQRPGDRPRFGMGKGDMGTTPVTDQLARRE